MSDIARKYGFGGMNTNSVPVHLAEDPTPPYDPGTYHPSGESFGYPAGYSSDPGAPLYTKCPEPEPMTTISSGNKECEQ